MQAEQTAAPRLMRYDAGLLFLWCLLISTVAAVLTKDVNVFRIFGFAMVPFVLSGALMFAGRKMPARLMKAMIVAAVLTALSTYGLLR